jgi:hypothetical protein
MFCVFDGKTMSPALEGRDTGAFWCPTCARVQITVRSEIPIPAFGAGEEPAKLEVKTVAIFTNRMEAAGQLPHLFQPSLF